MAAKPKLRVVTAREPLENFGEDIEHAYARHLFETRAEDTLVIRFMIAVIASQWLAENQELTWGYIVGPPSGSKTELVTPLLDWDLVHASDEATENALVSASDPTGMRARARANDDPDTEARYDPSLLRNLDGKILICKDLTSMASKPQRLEAFLGGLRVAFDCRVDKDSGTTGTQTFKARFGLLACMTPGMIDMTLGRMQSLGERSLMMRTGQYCTTMEEDERLGKEIGDSRRHKHRRRAELAEHVPKLLEFTIAQVKEYSTTTSHEQDPEIYRAVNNMAHLLVKIRTVSVEGNPQYHERVPRVLGQLMGLCDASALSYGRRQWGTPELALVRRVVRDTLPSQTLRLFQAIGISSTYRNPQHHMTVGEAVIKLGIRDEEWAEGQIASWVLNELVMVDGQERITLRPPVLKRCLELELIPKTRRT